MEQVSRFRRCRRLFAHSVSWCYLVFHTLFGNKMLYGINIGHHITSHQITYVSDDFQSTCQPRYLFEYACGRRCGHLQLQTSE